MDMSQKYRITVRGELGESWLDCLEGFEISPAVDDRGDATTSLLGPVSDQAALRGLLIKLWDFNLVLVSLALVQDQE